MLDGASVGPVKIVKVESDYGFEELSEFKFLIVKIKKAVY